MSHPFDPLRLKIARAKSHSNKADTFAKEFLKSDFYTVADYRDRKRRQVFRITECDPLPPEFGIIIGEAAHQLRSVLDHVIFILAKPATIYKQKYVQFPLLDRRSKFSGIVNSNLPGVPRGVRTLVESLQPYHRRKWPETQLLGQLKTVDDWDKHRMVMASVASSELTRLNFRNGEGTIIDQEVFTGVFKLGAIIARLTVKKFVPDRKVYMQPEFELLPVFEDGMHKQIRRVPCVRFIASVGTFIEGTVLPMFERFI